MEEPGSLRSMESLRVGHGWTTSLSRIGEGNGNPLQCSCLENPRGRGAWWAAVYGVTQSRTRLKRLSSSSSSSGYAISYFSFSVLLHSGWQSLGPSLLLQMALFPPLWRLSNVPFRDAPRRLHSFFCWWTFGCSHVWAAGSRAAANVGVHGPFRILLFAGYVPRSSGITGLYGRSIFTSQRNSVLFSIVAAPIYIPTNNVGGFPSFHTLSRIYCFWGFWW